jgi:transcriptional regulator with XRE-family HTH domain
LFEIGNSLRETRRRQGLALDDVAQATLIRNRYLDALEHERFELLPDGFYRRSFLRRYADYLGLDGDLYVDEYELRFAAEVPEPEIEPRLVRIRGPRSAPGLRALALVAVLAVILALAGWEFVGSHGNGHSPGGAAAAPRLAAGTVPPRLHGSATVAVAPRVLVLIASRGDCWLEVRMGSATGTSLYMATLPQGGVLRFGLGSPLWIRVGAPRNLDAIVAGRDVTGQLPASPADLVASAGGGLQHTS